MRLRLLLAAVCFVAAPAISAQSTFPGASWERVSDHTRFGWDRERLAAADETASTIGSAAYVVIQGGRIVHEWGEVTRRYNLHSIRKSVLSALIGIGMERGLIDTAATLAEMEIDDVQGLTAEERSVRLVDLMKSRSGVYHPAVYETPGMRRRRPERGSHPPGSFFYYNNWDFNAAGSAFVRQTGTSIFEAFDDWLARPLRMQDRAEGDTELFREPQSRHPAYLFRLSARDLARFGLLYANLGQWDDRHLLSPEWTRRSVETYSDVGLPGGFGYMWWTAPEGRGYPYVTLPPGSFSARGTGPQLLIVIPEFDVVIVHRVDTDSARELLSITDVGRLLRGVFRAHQSLAEYVDPPR